MKTNDVLVKAKKDILRLKEDNCEANLNLIKFILEIVKNRCGVLLANQLSKELKLDSTVTQVTRVELLN